MVADVMSFVNHELQVLYYACQSLLCQHNEKPCAAPCPTTFKCITLAAATPTAHAEQKRSRLIIILYGEAC